VVVAVEVVVVVDRCDAAIAFVGVRSIRIAILNIFLRLPQIV
jgi:hypothetical protein